MNDRERLTAALRQISQPCPFCDGSAAYAAWNWDRRRYVIKTVHPTGNCPALTPGAFQDRADAYLISLLVLYGVPVAEYADDDLIAHDSR